MDWLDYREKLGIGFNDEQKIKLFYAKMFNVLNGLVHDNSVNLRFQEYFDFCNGTGSKMNASMSSEYRGFDRFEHCIVILESHKKDINDFIAYYIWFANSVDEEKYGSWKRKNFINLITISLEESHIPYEVLTTDDNKCFIFPKGAKELDDALVSEPLEWLKGYPQAHKTYCIALKQYSDGIYIRDVADNLRKALEEFLQEFLGNSKNLETNKTEICKYLGSQGVDAGITGLFQPLINSYKNINDRIAKHNDAVDEKLLEFLLYQTGVLIRMVLSVNKSEEHNETE